MNWPTISAAPRLRTSGCVPVWQKRQESVQPTCEEMQTAPRSSRWIGDVDGLRLLPVAEAEQEFLRRVGADLRERDLRAADHEPLGELLLQRPRDRGHAREVGDALVVDPVPELLGAERRLADFGEGFGKLVAREADEIAPPVRQHRRRRGEMRGFGEDARALGFREIERRAHLAGQALSIAL